MASRELTSGTEAGKVRGAIGGRPFRAAARSGFDYV